MAYRRMHHHRKAFIGISMQLIFGQKVMNRDDWAALAASPYLFSIWPNRHLYTALG